MHNKDLVKALYNKISELRLYIINIELKYFSANNLHTYDGVSNSDIIGADVFFEIIEPEELGYTYRIRPAKDFGIPFVSIAFRYKCKPCWIIEHTKVDIQPVVSFIYLILFFNLPM